jgi:hypothetical protein
MSVFAPACTISAYPTLAPRYALHQVSGGVYGLEKQRKTFAVIAVGKLIELASATADVAILVECIRCNCEGHCLPCSSSLEVAEISLRML